MQKVFEKLKDKKLYYSLLITLVFFAIFLKMDFSTDTYSVLENSLTEMISHFLNAGRFVTAFWWWLVNSLHFSDGLIYLTSYIFAILCITIAIYNLIFVINKKVKNEAICILASTITIINPFTIELFLFLEKGILAFAVLLSVLAFSKFVKYLEGDKKALKYIFIFMLIATFSYQGVIGIFIALSTIYIVCYSKNVKDFIKNNIIILLGYGIPAIINLLVIRVFYSNERVNGAINISQSIQKVISGTSEMFNTYAILPKYTFGAIIAILIICAIVLLITNKKEKITTKILKILGLAYVCLVTLAITIVPQLMQNTESIWFVPRSTYPFGAIVGIISIYILINCSTNLKFNIKKINVINLVIGAIAIILLTLQLYNYNKIEIDHYNLNYMDKINCLKIGNEIKLYEQETGNKVTKICIYNDKNTSYTYPQIWVSKDTNITGFLPEWSIINMINYYNNRNLVQGENDPEIESSFKEQDWDDFSQNQIIFIGDTLHYCRF